MDFFGEKIRELRKIRKLTQEQLAKKCGVSTSCVSRWENNSLQPNFKNILALAKALSANIIELFPSFSTQSPDSLIICEIISILEQMTEAEQKFVLETLVRYQEVKLASSSIP